MEMDFFGRFHMKAGGEREFAQALDEVVVASRKEPGCLEIHGYRSNRDGRLFYIHSRWKDEEAFEEHRRMAHTVKYLERVKDLSDQEPDLTRSERIC